MLPQSTVEEIEKLLASGITSKEINKRTGFHRNTIDTIRRKQHPVQLAREADSHKPKESSLQRKPKLKLPKPLHPDNHLRLPPDQVPRYNRCPGCGGMIQADAECLVCTRKHQLSQGHLPPDDPTLEQDLPNEPVLHQPTRAWLDEVLGLAAWSPPGKFGTGY
jgi:hypothetical protein